jgi:hypothetical protein
VTDRQPGKAAGPQYAPLSYLSEKFLKELPSPPPNVQVFSDLPKVEGFVLPPADLLIVNLVWCESEVWEIEPFPSVGGSCDPPAVKKKAAADGPAPARAVYSRPASYVEPAPVVEPFGAISSLLDATCYPGSPDQTKQCLKIVRGVRRARGRVTLDDDACRSIIRGGLAGSEWWGSMPLLKCRHETLREALVVGLFRMV